MNEEERRAQKRQMDIDWMWWVFMAAGLSITEIATRLEKDQDKVRAMIDRIIAGEVEINLVENNPHMDRLPWTKRQEKILVKMRAAGLHPTHVSRLLSRSTWHVKQRVKQLSHH